MKDEEDPEHCSVIGKDFVDSDKGKQVIVMNSGGLKANYQHVYPGPLAKYADVVQDSKLFMDILGKLHATMGTKFMIPTIGGKELNLHRLFVEVTSRGGIEKVVADKKWREITAVFNFPSTATNASFVLRKYYMSLLHHFEQIYFFGSEGWNSPPTASSNTPSSVPPAKLEEPSSQYSSSILGIRKQRTNGELAPTGISLPANRSTFGVIDGKFEHGYFVTVTVGTQKLKGVLFHSPTQTSQFPGVADNSNARVGQRRRRRRKLSKLDPTHPKPNRSGYNFFFADQHARLKPLHPGRDREISKMIGVLWNNLTESEKAVYQERGVKDKERYENEMAVYKGSKKRQVVSNVMPIQQRLPEPIGVIDDMSPKLEMDEGDLDEANEDSGSSDDGSDETEGKKSDEELELRTSPDIGRTATESPSLAAEPPIKGDGFELRRRDQLQTEGENPSISEDAESKKMLEPSSDQQ